ncbi:MAG: ATP-binding protein [Kiritimatiellae bacterium]|nr:ATP-binding protein [Kiritimatiellia bacterium]
MRMKQRFIGFPSGSFFFFGPRGTGKTVWLTSQFPEAFVVNLLKADIRRSLTARPERLIDIVDANADRKTFVIDEIQRVPALLDTIHDLIEKRRTLRFILTGSSARELKRTQNADLLGGRAVKCLCHPFLASEMGNDFTLADALRLGMIPLVRYPIGQNPEAVLNTYLDLYLQEEVVNEGVIRKLDVFSRFLETASFSHGTVLSASAIAREADVKRSTVDVYFEILEEMLVTSRLPVFSKRAKRAIVSHQKFYFFDAGVFRALRPKGPLDRPEEIDGMALEGLVHQHLRAWLDYSGERNALFFWRTRAGLEVDFIVYNPSEFAAIEVKNAAKIKTEDLAGLKAFRDDYPECRTLLLYRGRQQTMVDGILVAPVERFLKGLVPHQPLPDSAWR